jgi:hypothetical protein
MRILRLIAYCIFDLLILLVVAAALWYMPGVRNGWLDLNGSLLNWIYQLFRSTKSIPADSLVFLEWLLLVLEIVLLTLITSGFIRRIEFNGGFSSVMTFAFEIMLLAVISSVAMAIYMYLILWGSYKPEVITPDMTKWLGIIGAWYAVIQAIPFIIRREVGFTWALLDMFSSVIPLGVVAWTLFKLAIGQYAWSTYRLDALEIWSGIEFLDIVNVGIMLRLIARGVFGAVVSDPQNAPHPHH